MKMMIYKLFFLLGISIFFLGCLFDWQYGYYQLVRFIGMIGFIVLAGFDSKNKLLSILWISSALLINPFIKISLGRTIWNIVDIIWVVILIITVIYERPNNKKIISDEQN